MVAIRGTNDIGYTGEERQIISKGISKSGDR